MTVAARAAVIGRPVAHSLSPAIHTAAFIEMGVPWDYVAIDCGVDELAGVVAQVRTGELSALSVTMPLKEAVIGHLDAVSDTARALGAVNCVSVSDGRLVGHNTDGEGCCDALEQQGGLALDGAHVLLLGAGGTARAVALSLALRGAHVSVRNRTRTNAELVRDAVVRFGGDVAGSVSVVNSDASSDSVPSPDPAVTFDAIVNATSVGMGTDETPLDATDIHQGTVVLDAVYSPLETRLLREARTHGAHSVDGLWMLIHQARHQEMIWLGRAGSVRVMRAESERVLATRAQ